MFNIMFESNSCCCLWQFVFHFSILFHFLNIPEFISSTVNRQLSFPFFIILNNDPMNILLLFLPENNMHFSVIKMELLGHTLCMSLALVNNPVFQSDCTSSI